MRRLSGVGKVLLLVLAVYVVVDILLTPLARLETRDPSLVTMLGVLTLILLFAGLLLAIVSAVFLLRGSQRAGVLALIAAVLYFPAPVTEWTGHFSKLRPPAAIATLELLQALIAVLMIVLAILAIRGRPAAG